MAAIDGVAALLATHDRREQTLACLAHLDRQDAGVDVRVALVDASSPDGTAAAVRAAHPDAVVEEVGADVHWNRGMHRAWQLALDLEVDAWLWLNDDTMLDPTALATLLAVDADHRERTGRGAIVVGSTRDPASGALTYGGVVRPSPRLRPLRYDLVEPGAEPRPCETMNGNVVLVPRDVVEAIGILDPTYAHGMGDYDYGLRARDAGIARLVAPGTVGTCARNAPPPADRTVGDEWARLRRPTGLPPDDFATFARRWAGPLWPVFWASPYVRRLSRRLVRRTGQAGKP